MEQINNILPNNINVFFKELSDYIDRPLYFYGSVQRNDYFPGDSDIDVDIFTDNQTSIISKMQQFLSVKKKKFKKIIWRLNNVVAFGYKLMYKDIEMNIAVEFSIYDENIKKYILEEHNKKIVLPFYISWLLFILKVIYYKLHLMNRDYYRYLKKNLLAVVDKKPEGEFLSL